MRILNEAITREANNDIVTYHKGGTDGLYISVISGGVSLFDGMSRKAKFRVNDCYG
jgi:hypothetical protein